MGLRARVPTCADDPDVVLGGEFDGVLVDGAAAGVCGQRAAWRGAYAGVADGCIGGGSGDFGDVAGAEEDGAGADADGASVRSALLGVALILFGFSHVLWLSVLLMMFVGFGMLQAASASNTIIQSLVTEGMRARVMSYYTMAFFGAAPFGSLLAGVLAHFFGAAADGDVYRSLLFGGGGLVQR